MQIDFSSYNVGDEDYCGYDYSLVGQLSEVRIVYLNRFVQEVGISSLFSFLILQWFNLSFPLSLPPLGGGVCVCADYQLFYGTCSKKF